MSVHTPRFNRLNGLANHYILWMYLHLPTWFNKHVTTRLYRLSEFITMKELKDWPTDDYDPTDVKNWPKPNHSDKLEYDPEDFGG